MWAKAPAQCLVGQGHAIVTPIPGTTRDALAQTIHIDDVPIHVVDTAGLRDDQLTK